MTSPVLIVRTVSVEKLAPVLDACVSRWPQHPLVVVSSSARAGELRSDPRVAEVIPYDSPAGFSTPIAYDQQLEAVVVPVGNRGGSGYANVMHACRRLHTRGWFIASYARDLRQLSPMAWRWRRLREQLLQTPARWFGILWTWWILR